MTACNFLYLVGLGLSMLYGLHCAPQDLSSTNSKGGRADEGVFTHLFNNHGAPGGGAEPGLETAIASLDEIISGSIGGSSRPQVPDSQQGVPVFASGAGNIHPASGFAPQAPTPSFAATPPLPHPQSPHAVNVVPYFSSDIPYRPTQNFNPGFVGHGTPVLSSGGFPATGFGPLPAAPELVNHAFPVVPAPSLPLDPTGTFHTLPGQTVGVGPFQRPLTFVDDHVRPIILIVRDASAKVSGVLRRIEDHVEDILN